MLFQIQLVYNCNYDIRDFMVILYYIRMYIYVQTYSTHIVILRKLANTNMLYINDRFTQTKLRKQSLYNTKVTRIRTVNANRIW